jgi:hypothetical protein
MNLRDLSKDVYPSIGVRNHELGIGHLSRMSMKDPIKQEHEGHYAMEKVQHLFKV